MLAFPFPSRQAGNRQVAISLARVVLFRASASVLTVLSSRCLNLSCESSAFQGMYLKFMQNARMKCLNLSCESSAFQGYTLAELQELKNSCFNLSCERLLGPSAGSGTLLLSYCDRGERSGNACIPISEPTSRQPTGCHLSCESSAFQASWV